MHSTHSLVLRVASTATLRSFCLGLLLALAANGAEPPAFATGDQARVFGVREVVLRGGREAANPFDVPVTVRFVPPSGAARAVTVSAFHDGDDVWRARTYVSEAGEWTWSSECPTDAALHGQRGRFAATPSTLRGRLLIHPKNPRQWMTEDGRWFLHLNDTAYYLLSARDRLGDHVTAEDFQAYVGDAVARGITAFRCFLTTNRTPASPAGADGVEGWFGLLEPSRDRVRLDLLQESDRRLRWLLDHHPDVAVQLILFPLEQYRTDTRFWPTLTAEQKQRLLKYLVARFAAYPQILWLVFNDAHYAPVVGRSGPPDAKGGGAELRFPQNIAVAREVGEFFRQHDPWQHPMSTGPARTAPFHFEQEPWATYIHLENNYDVGAAALAPYRAANKPVFLGEDRYEQDHLDRDPRDMRYFQRRLFWSWLLAGGSANYGGRWWVVHPYSQTGVRPATLPGRNPPRTHREPLTGLDSVRVIRDYFVDRRIELSDFAAAPALVRDADGRVAADAPALMRRGGDEFLIYHPNGTSAGKSAQADPARPARLWLDLSAAPGRFDVEWLRPHDGASARGPIVDGGRRVELTSPWVGHDAVVRLVRTEAQRPTAAIAAPTARDRASPEQPLAPAPTRQDPRNLAGNPGFELGKPEPWELIGTGASVTADGVHAGRGALHLLPGTSAVQTLRGLEPGALYVVRGWLHSVKGKAEMSYAESHKTTNGKYLFAGAASGTGRYELTTLLFRPELDPVSSRGHVDVKLRLYTENNEGEALMDDFEVQRGELAGPDLLGAVRFDAAEIARWNAGTTEPVSVPDGGPGGGPCLQLVKKGYMSFLLQGLSPNTTYAATAWVRGQWFRFGAGRYGFRTDHISINSPTEFVPRTIGFTTGPDATSVRIYFLQPADGRPAFVDSVEVRRVEVATEATGPISQ